MCADTAELFQNDSKCFRISSVLHLSHLVTKDVYHLFIEECAEVFVSAVDFIWRVWQLIFPGGIVSSLINLFPYPSRLVFLRLSLAGRVVRASLWKTVGHIILSLASSRLLWLLFRSLCDDLDRTVIVVSFFFPWIMLQTIWITVEINFRNLSVWKENELLDLLLCNVLLFVLEAFICMANKNAKTSYSAVPVRPRGDRISLAAYYRKIMKRHVCSMLLLSNSIFCGWVTKSLKRAKPDTYFLIQCRAASHPRTRRNSIILDTWGRRCAGMEQTWFF